LRSSRELCPSGGNHQSSNALAPTLPGLRPSEVRMSSQSWLHSVAPGKVMHQATGRGSEGGRRGAPSAAVEAGDAPTVQVAQLLSRAPAPLVAPALPADVFSRDALGTSVSSQRFFSSPGQRIALWKGCPALFSFLDSCLRCSRPSVGREQLRTRSFRVEINPRLLSAGTGSIGGRAPETLPRRVLPSLAS